MASIGMMKAIVAIFIVRIDRWNGFHIIDLIILKWKRQKRKFLSRVKIYVKCKILIYTFSNIYLYEWENEILLSNTMHNIPHNYRTYGRGGVFFKENPMYLTIKWIQKSNVLTVNTNTFPYFIPKKCTFRVFHQSKYVIIVFLDFSSITHQCMYLLLSALLTFQLVAIVQKKEREKWCIHFITRNLAKIYMKLLCTIAEKTLYKSFYIHHWCHAWPFKARFFSVRSYNRAATWDYHIDIYWSIMQSYASLFFKKGKEESTTKFLK